MKDLCGEGVMASLLMHGQRSFFLVLFLVLAYLFVLMKIKYVE